jgi:DNA-binding beta-propeller fold protein YncE
MMLFRMNFGQTRTRSVQTGAAFLAAALVAGCGSQYRPVVTPIYTNGPAPQPTSYAVVVSAPSTTTPGIATMIDYSGDTIMAQAPIGPGPTAFTIDPTGSYGYTLNSDGTLTNFPVSITNLQAKNITYSTLPTGFQPAGLYSLTLGLWIPDLDGNVVDIMSNIPADFKLAIPVAATPVAIMGSGQLVGQRNYAISQGFADPTGVACNTSPTTAPLGVADAIEGTSLTISARIPLGKCPVYAVQSPDGRRLFVLNRGDDTITVINSLNNTLDSCTPFQNQNGQQITCHPSLPLSTTAVNALNTANPGSGNPPNGTSGMGTIAGPVYAEFNPATNELVVSNYDGNTISMIDVSLDVFGNDSPTFGTTYTMPVGNNPASVTVLADGSRAYAANQADSTVTVVNLISHTVEKTLPVIGHPRTVVSIQNSLYGKVYVASPDKPNITILRTDLDIVDTAVLVEGDVVDVRVSSPNGSNGANMNYVSRVPGRGQPCNLPGTTVAATLVACQTQP